jgi:hypothetical protein
MTSLTVNANSPTILMSCSPKADGQLACKEVPAAADPKLAQDEVNIKGKLSRGVLPTLKTTAASGLAAGAGGAVVFMGVNKAFDLGWFATDAAKIGGITGGITGAVVGAITVNLTDNKLAATVAGAVVGGALNVWGGSGLFSGAASGAIGGYVGAAMAERK